MAAILAGRQDYAATLVELGFADKIFLEALGAGDEGTQYDGYSQNARIVKAALCAGIFPILPSTASVNCLVTRRTGPIKAVLQLRLG